MFHQSIFLLGISGSGLQRAACMTCITSEEEPANTQFFRAVLMHLVQIEAHESVLRRQGMAWKHGSETGGLSFEIFIPCQTDNVSIKGSLQAVIRDSSGHGPVFWIYYKIYIVPAVFSHIIVDLTFISVW